MHWRQYVRKLPWDLPCAVGMLVAIGLAGIARADQLAETDGVFFRRQCVWCGLAAAVLFLSAWPNYRVLCRYSYLIYLAILALLVAVYWFPAVNGAHRWIRLGPVSLQPSELAKVAVVMVLARWLMYRQAQRQLGGLIVPILLAMLPVALILREPDLGTSIVFLPVLGVMLWSAGAKTIDLGLLAGFALLALPVLWFCMSAEQRSRVTTLWEDTRPGVSVSDDAYHLYQSKQMLSLGGRWGSWWSGDKVDDPAAYRLPEGQSDFVFCIVTERFGLAGALATLMLFAWLVVRGVHLAGATREPYGRLLVLGLVALVGFEVAVNTAMTVGLAPITGLSLPLVSYGGSGLIAHAAALGLVMNVSLRPGFDVTGEPFPI